jgi:hypothetical protein
MGGLDPAESFGSAVFAQAKSYGFNLQKFRLARLRHPRVLAQGDGLNRVWYIP